ncbi:hypothetical protein KAU93_02785, partial [Candidatus Bathyarchaeota archaeon]|nr:hypothetical protein [Candidatus Bathyarchaeota archaeon]
EGIVFSTKYEKRQRIIRLKKCNSNNGNNGISPTKNVGNIDVQHSKHNVDSEKLSSRDTVATVLPLQQEEPDSFGKKQPVDVSVYDSDRLKRSFSPTSTEGQKAPGHVPSEEFSNEKPAARDLNPDFLWRRVPPAEKCESCGRFAVEYEINLVEEHQILRRCQSCFEKMRCQFNKAVWKQASGESTE